MDFESLKKYCLNKKGAESDFPFDDETLTFRVGQKMFALININRHPLKINLKCDPFIALDLRERYEGIIPGWHMNKKHWNTVLLDGSVPDDELYFMIDLSYRLAYKNLTRKQKSEIENCT